MSPNSSSTCRAGKNARSATLEPSLPAPPRVAVGGSRELYAMRTRCATGYPRRDPMSRAQAATHAQQPLISCRHREGTESLRAGRASAHARRCSLSGCGGGTEQTHGEVKRSYKIENLARRRFPTKQSIAGPTDTARQGAQRRKPNDAERGGHRRLLLLRRKISRTGRQQAPGVGGRTAAPGVPRASRAELRPSARRAAGRPRTSTRGRSGR